MGVRVKQSSIFVTGFPASLPSRCARSNPEGNRGLELIQSHVVFCRPLPGFPLLGRQALFATIGTGIHGWAPAAVGPPVCGYRLGHMSLKGE